MLVQYHQGVQGSASSSGTRIRNRNRCGSCLPCKPICVASEVRPQSELLVNKYSSIHDALHTTLSVHSTATATASSDDVPLLAAGITPTPCQVAQEQEQQMVQSRSQQEQQLCQQQQQPQEELKLAPVQARQLTAHITLTTDITQLLLLLVEHIQQLDHIHVSAAVKHACRRLQLVITMPEQQQASQGADQQSQQHQQQQHRHVDALQWLQHELQVQQVQLRVAELHHEQEQRLHRDGLSEREQQQQQQPWQHSAADRPISSNEQQHDQLNWVVKQQFQPQELLQQQLAAVQNAHQQQQHNKIRPIEDAEHKCTTTAQQAQQPDLPSDSWLLLLLLSQLVAQHSSSMASQQLCTCLNSLTHLLLRHPALPLLGQPMYCSAVQRLLLGAGRQVAGFDHRALSVLMHSAAAVARSPLGFAPSQGFMRQWYRRSRAVMSQASALDLAMAAWALGRLGAYPPTQWASQFFMHSKAAIPALQPQELLLLLLGVADMERTPRRSTTAAAARAGWVPAAAKQLQAHVQNITPHQLSGALLAFAKLQYQPSKEWLAAVAHAWESQQGQFGTKGHSMVLWGVGALTQTEAGSREARLAWARQIQAALQQAVSRAATAVAAVALLKLRQAKEQQQQQQNSLQKQHRELSQEQDQEQCLTDHQQQQGKEAVPVNQQQQQQHDIADALNDNQPLQDLSQQLQLQQPVPVQQEQPQLLSSASLLHPTDCAMVISALARLGPSCLDAEFALFWLRQSKSQLSNMNSQELANCVWALGRLGLQPPADWLQQHLACSAQLAPCMSHQQLAMLLWGLAKLQYLPDVFVSAELLMSAAEQLPTFSSHSLALLVYALGLLRLKPNKELMHLLLAQAKNKLMRFDAQDLCGLLVGLYRLRYNPGQQWLGLYAQTLAAKVHLLPAKKHAVIVQVLRAMGYTCQGRPFAWVMDEAAVAAMCDRGGGSGSKRRRVLSSGADSRQSSTKREKGREALLLE